MIPRKIHYCWFGGSDMGPKEKFCLESWKKYCPNYEVVRWDETNCQLNEIPYMQQAYAAKKWAFVSDYVRIKVLFEQGGIYLDTDVELKKPVDEFLSHQAFMGFEDDAKVATCLIGAKKGHPFLEEIMEEYQKIEFINPDGSFDYTTNVERISEMLKRHGLKADGTRQNVAGVLIYPQTWFSPKSLETGKIALTENTYAIHHFRASWMPLKNRINTRLAQLLGPQKTSKIKQLLRRN